MKKLPVNEVEDAVKTCDGLTAVALVFLGLIILCVLCALCGCASPSAKPGIGSFGTRAGYTAEHLAVGTARTISQDVASVSAARATATSLTGPYTLDIFPVTFRAPLKPINPLK